MGVDDFDAAYDRMTSAVIPPDAASSNAWPSGRGPSASLPTSCRSAGRRSQHLKVLKHAGLVTEQAAGTRRIYRLNPIGVAALRDQLDTFWNRALTGYTDVVEQPPEERP